MARSKTPKTKGVPEVVSTASAEKTVANAVPEVAVQDSAVIENATKKVKAAAKLEAVKPERRNLVPINLEEEIRRLAYLMSERRGFEPGHESEDWLAAEHEVLQRYRQHSA